MLSQPYTYRRLSRRASGSSQPKALCGNSSVRIQGEQRSDLCLESRTLDREPHLLGQMECRKAHIFQSIVQKAIPSLNQTEAPSSLPGIERYGEGTRQKTLRGWNGIFSAYSRTTDRDFLTNAVYASGLIHRGDLRAILCEMRSHLPDALRASVETLRFLLLEIFHGALSVLLKTFHGFSRTMRDWIVWISQDLPLAMRAFARLVSHDVSREMSCYSHSCGTSLNNTFAGSAGAQRKPRISDIFSLVKTSFNNPYPNQRAPRSIAFGL